MASDRECGVLILKQGFLRKLPNQTKIGASLKRSYRQWVTFGLTREQQPYLAFYTNADSVTTSAPLKAVPLRTCRHITKSLNLKGQTNVFTLTLSDRQLSLMAPTIDLMDEWCRLLDTTLKSLGILKPDENLYTVRQWNQQQQNQQQHQHYQHQQNQQQHQQVDRSPSEEVFRRASVVHLDLPAPPPQISPSNSSPLGSRDPNSPLPLAPSPSALVPARGRLPPLPAAAADRTNNNPVAMPDSPILTEQDDNQQQAGGASGAPYEAVWVPNAGPASGPEVLPPVPPHRNRLQTPAEAPASRQGAPLPASHLAVEAEYGVIWPASGRSSNNNSNSTNNSSNTTNSRNTTNSAPAGHQAVAERDIANSAISLPGYTERDESGRPACPQPAGSSYRLQGLSVPQASPPYSPQPASGAPGCSPLVPAGATGYSFSPAPPGQAAALSSPLPSKMMEALGIDGSEQQGTGPQVYGWNAPPLDDHDAPPPYMPRSMTNRGPQKSLKETQVEALMKEISHAGGVRVTLRKTDCHLTIAWVDCCGATWIAGWNQKARPFLHNAFHVGDQVVSINGQVVENARMAHKLIKHSDDQARITFILKRIPSARVYALKRNEDGEDLGFRREGGTGKIIDVVPYGVAARHGVPARAPTMDHRSLCNWYITEINMRPINLFFKEDEIEKRLNAVGKDISILIQPSDLITEIKIQLKKNLKGNYKDFVVQ